MNNQAVNQEQQKPSKVKKALKIIAIILFPIYIFWKIIAILFKFAFSQ